MLAPRGLIALKYDGNFAMALQNSSLVICPSMNRWKLTNDVSKFFFSPARGLYSET